MLCSLSRLMCLPSPQDLSKSLTEQPQGRVVGSGMSHPARKIPREAAGALPCVGFCPHGAAIAAPGHGLHGPGVRPRVGILLFTGFLTGLGNFSLIPLMTTRTPRFVPRFPRGMLGRHKVFELAGQWEQAGHPHGPETQGTALGSPRGGAGDKGPL